MIDYISSGTNRTVINKVQGGHLSYDANPQEVGI